MRDEIRRQLVERAETKYRDFSSSLIPKSKPLLGVRLPVLRKLAKDVIKNMDWKREIESYEGQYEDIYFEEVMLRGIIIGYGTQKEEVHLCIILTAGVYLLQIIDAHVDAHLQDYDISDDLTMNVEPYFDYTAVGTKPTLGFNMSLKF